MKKSSRPERSGIIKILLLIIVFFSPLLINYVVLFINGYGLSLKNLLLYTNDEVYWHAQTAGAVKYGIPAGYFGYNGSSAKIGTFNTWGPFPFIPYVICGKIFGMNIYTRHIVNIFFMGAALVCFLLLINADIRKIIGVSVIFYLMPANIAYLLTFMSEPERFALSVILAGILLRLVLFDCGKHFKYLVSPVIIISACFVYYLFLIMIPLYIFIVFRKRSLFFKLVISAVAGALASFVVFYLTGIMSSPYNIRSGLSDSIDQMIGYISSGDTVVGSVSGVLGVIWRNMAHFGPVNLINISYFENGFCSVYIAVYELSLVIFGIAFVLNINNREYAGKLFPIIYIMTGFILAFAFLYAEEPLTVIRGLNCGLLIGGLFFIGSDMYKKISPVYGIVQLIIFSLVFISGIGFINGICDEEYRASQKTEHIMNERSIISGRMETIPKRENRWGNTIAYYGDLSTEYLEIPDGFGLNYMTRGDIDDRMGWAVLNKKEGPDRELLKNLTESFNIIYENEDFYIMKNKKPAQ